MAAARLLGGTVAIPADPGIAVSAGLPPTEDQVAAADVLRASDQSAKAVFMASLARAVATEKYSAIITEFHGDLRGFPADLPIYYYECPQMPRDGAPVRPVRRERRGRAYFRMAADRARALVRGRHPDARVLGDLR